MGKTSFLLLLLSTLLLAGCATTPKTPVVLAPGFASLPLRQITLAPVIFRDEPIDRYFAARVGDEILVQSRQQLAAKGYQTQPPGDETVLFPFQDAAVGPFPPAPGTDAVLIIEVDHFLDAVLYDWAPPTGLDIYATATLTSASGELLWQDTGVGSGPRQPTIPGQMDWFMAPASLAQSLFATLPARTENQQP